MSTELTPEEIAKARATLLRYGRPPLERAHFLLGRLFAEIRAYDRTGFDPGRNRDNLALIAAYEQLRDEEATP